VCSSTENGLSIGTTPKSWRSSPEKDDVKIVVTTNQTTVAKITNDATTFRFDNPLFIAVAFNPTSNAL
jgi:hypothetical protein